MDKTDSEELKDSVREFWDAASCGEIYATGSSERDYYDSHRIARYKLEPYIAEFAQFPEGRNLDVLEVGVGMGADHVEWGRAGCHSLTGVDFTPRAVEHTQRRMCEYGMVSKVMVADAEHLPFPDNAFDMIYSWGVIHHSPNTQAASHEILRVLRPGRTALVMIYHRYSLTGYMLWARYGLMAGHPFRSLDSIYAEHLESPGTKAYSVEEARAMFAGFSEVNVEVRLSFGDLLQGAVGQRHQGPLLRLAKVLWPRWLIRRLFRRHGLMLLIEARK